VGSIDFSCIKLWLKRKQNSVIKKVKTIHERKLSKLGVCPIKTHLDPKKVIHNYSSRLLTSEEIKVLLLGLDFGLPIRKLNFFNYYLIFEKLYSILAKQAILENGLNSLSNFRNEVKRIADRYFYGFKPARNVCPVFSKNEFCTLKALAEDRSI
jgi:hypothetical protein